MTIARHDLEAVERARSTSERANLAQSRQTERRHDLVSRLVMLGFAASSLYMFPPGSPQVVHVIFAALAVVALSRPVFYASADVWLGLLCLVALLRTSIDAVSIGTPEPLVDFAHVTYPVMIFFVARQFAYDPSNDGAIRQGVLAAIVIAFVVLVLTGDYTLKGDIERAVGTFNNPNQLAYFAILATALLALFSFVGRIDARWLFGGLAITTFLSIVALSKSGMVAQYVALAVIARVYLREKLGNYGMFIVMVGGVALLIYALNSGAFDDMTFMARLSDFGGQSDDNIAERGYFVAFTGNPIDLVFGIGPSSVYEKLDHEVHSTIFSFLGKYGVIGFLVFCGFLADWGLKLLRAFGFWRTLALVTGFMLYGVAHNGSRFAIFWLLAAVSYAFAERSIAVASSPGLLDRRGMLRG